jgi:hypothetical protein
MTEFLQTLALSGNGTILAVPTTEDSINVIPTPQAGVVLSIATAPTGATYTYTAGTVTYTTTEKYTATNTLITFTATVALPNVPAGLAIIEYYWDFGDGNFSYGNPATHTYKLSGLSPQAVLRVTDNYGRQWFCRKQIYLT